MSTIISDRHFNNPTFKIQQPDGTLPKGADVLLPMTPASKMVQGRSMREGPTMENISSRRAELSSSIQDKMSERKWLGTTINQKQHGRPTPEYKFR